MERHQQTGEYLFFHILLIILMLHILLGFELCIADNWLSSLQIFQKSSPCSPLRISFNISPGAIFKGTNLSTTIVSDGQIGMVLKYINLDKRKINQNRQLKNMKLVVSQELDSIGSLHILKIIKRDYIPKFNIPYCVCTHDECCGSLSLAVKKIST